MHEFRQKLELTHKPSRLRKSIKAKHTFRIKAHDQKNKLVFLKTRTKQPVATIKRIATLHGLTTDRITK